MAFGPLAGKVVDRFAPWHGILFGTLLLLVFQGVQTAAGGINIAAVVIACVGLDAVRQVQNVSIVTCIFRYVLISLQGWHIFLKFAHIHSSIDMEAISRLNALFVLAVRLRFNGPDCL